MDIGRRIQALRTRNGLSQETLAERLDISRQSVSKWELRQALPDAEKIVQLSQLFGVTTDALLQDTRPAYTRPNKQKLHFGMYLIVKDFNKSIDFYEKLFSLRLASINPNRFAEFYIDGVPFSLMNESNLTGHDYTGSGDHKFTLNFWISDLAAEFERVKSLNIGKTTDIIHAHTSYYFFNVYDPDGNVIEITGQYEGGKQMQTVPMCQSCYMAMDAPEKFGKEKDGSQNSDYCCHCWKNGKFAWNATLEQAVESNISWWREEDDENDDAARARIMEVFPKLKRWAK